MYTSKNIIALHGFLGSPKDFSFLEHDFIGVHLFNTQICTMDRWCKKFNTWVHNKPILLGYSLGGRLALQIAIKAPEKYSGLIIINAHPGLHNYEDRLKRVRSDYVWAQRFLKDDWQLLLDDWNKQKALQNSPIKKRNEGDYCRNTLSLVMRKFSLGHQEFLPPKINGLNMPILWICSSEEKQKVSTLNFKHKLSQLLFINGSHRLIFEKPNRINRHIKQFYRSFTTRTTL